MNPIEHQADTGATREPAALTRALDQSEQVKDKVEECAAELSSVNAVLKQEIAEGVPPQEVKRAIIQSEEVEAKVQECAAELDTVNNVLAEEIEERKHVDHLLTISDTALTESKARESRWRHSALYDAVTGLPNLILFKERLHIALAHAQRHKWRLAVMFIDLDEFKSINDTHGHDVGDRILQIVAQRLQRVVRGSDTICRRSGDEFLFLMLEAKDETNVTNFAVKIIDNIAKMCMVSDLNLTVRPSIGIALYPEDGQLEDELLKNADTAMYAAKSQKEGYFLYSQIAVP